MTYWISYLLLMRVYSDDDILKLSRPTANEGVDDTLDMLSTADEGMNNIVSTADEVFDGVLSRPTADEGVGDLRCMLSTANEGVDIYWHATIY